MIIPWRTIHTATTTTATSRWQLHQQQQQQQQQQRHPLPHPHRHVVYNRINTIKNHKMMWRVTRLSMIISFRKKRKTRCNTMRPILPTPFHDSINIIRHKPHLPTLRRTIHRHSSTWINWNSCKSKRSDSRRRGTNTWRRKNTSRPITLTVPRCSSVRSDRIHTCTCRIGRRLSCHSSATRRRRPMPGGPLLWHRPLVRPTRDWDRPCTF